MGKAFSLPSSLHHALFNLSDHISHVLGQIVLCYHPLVNANPSQARFSPKPYEQGDRLYQVMNQGISNDNIVTH